MAIELLLLNFDGTDGRTRGTIIDVKEAPDGISIGWGRDEKPPLFCILRIEGVDKSGVNPDLLAIGAHVSKLVIDDARLTPSERAALNDVRAYPGDHGQPPSIARANMTVARLHAVLRDNSAVWNAHALLHGPA